MTTSTETWNDPAEGDYMEITIRENGSVYGVGNSFDFERDSYAEAKDQLEAWGYHKL